VTSAHFPRKAFLKIKGNKHWVREAAPQCLSAGRSGKLKGGEKCGDWPHGEFAANAR
jgi:hypothetical protein